MKIAFFGTSNRSEPILEILHKNFDLKLCVTKTDRIVGRERKKSETKVKSWAKKHGIEIFEIYNMKSSETALLTELINYGIDMIIVADFGFIIGKEIIEKFKDNIINIHFSLLPKYRGANPVQAAILNGDTKTGITFTQVVYELDAGDIIAQFPVPLKGNETSGELYSMLFAIASQKITQVITDYQQKKITPMPQDPTKATYFFSKSHPKSTFIYKEDAKLNWQDSAEINERKVRAFNPWPVAWTTLGDLEKYLQLPLKPKIKKNLNLKIYSAEISHSVARPEEVLIPKEICVEGRRKMDWKSFLNGYCSTN